jgi:hypothetical protein
MAHHFTVTNRPLSIMIARCPADGNVRGSTKTLTERLYFMPLNKPAMPVQQGQSSLSEVPRTPATVSPKGGFVQTFGLDIRVAILAVVIDSMVFGATWITGGVLYVVELGAGVVLAFITYKIQRVWYGDNHDSALIKALVIGLLTAIPAPITGIFAGPGGILGLIHLFRNRK